MKPKGITGDITERLASFASAGAQAQRAADEVIKNQIASKIEAITEATDPLDLTMPLALDPLERQTIIFGLGALTIVALRDKNTGLLHSIERTAKKFGVTLDMADNALNSERKKKGRNR